jgi:DNA (cytosine-5)-methyltransferase 1
VQRSSCVDLFAGGGGASEGIRLATGRGPAVAIDHDPAAVLMHATNHPGTLHLCEDVFAVAPFRPGGRPIDLLWASPDCTHHSRAKGGKPRDNKRRMLAWVVVEWARSVHPRVICLENVPEFRSWGPLDDEGHPIPERAGETFDEFVGALTLAGYRVEHRELIAADYGAPTTRKRLYLVARCDREPIRWPDPTHGRGRELPWRTAAECIDWSIPCPSIFERARPLAPATEQRIAEGIRRYVLTSARPFIRPVGTVTAVDHHSLAAVFLDKLHGSARAGQPLDQPAPTVTAGGGRGGGHAALVSAFLMKYYGAGGQWSDLGEPMHTVVTRARMGLVTVQVDGEEYALVDIGMRMLTPRELARAQGFSDAYILTGSKANQIARIGNSVCPPVAEALVRAQLKQDVFERRAA